jgi:hypothetical protein
LFKQYYTLTDNKESALSNRFYSLNEMINGNQQNFEGKVFKILDLEIQNENKVNFKYVQIKNKILNQNSEHV